jgi:hypothetical protein
VFVAGGGTRVSLIRAASDPSGVFFVQPGSHTRRVVRADAARCWREFPLGAFGSCEMLFECTHLILKHLVLEVTLPLVFKAPELDMLGRLKDE